MRRIIFQPIGTEIEKENFIEAKNTSWGQKEQYKEIFKDSIGDTVLFIKNRIRNCKITNLPKLRRIFVSSWIVS